MRLAPTTRKTLGASLALALLLTGAPVFAGGFHHGHWRHGFHGHHHPHHRFSHHRFRHHRRHDHDAGFLVGGIILGSLIMNAYQRDDYYRGYYRPYRAAQPVVIRRTVAPPPPTGRTLYRDRDGNCFERQFDAAGNELLIELPDSACDW